MLELSTCAAASGVLHTHTAVARSVAIEADAPLLSAAPVACGCDQSSCRLSTCHHPQCTHAHTPPSAMHCVCARVCTAESAHACARLHQQQSQYQTSRFISPANVYRDAWLSGRQCTYIRVGRFACVHELGLCIPCMMAKRTTCKHTESRPAVFPNIHACSTRPVNLP